MHEAKANGSISARTDSLRILLVRYMVMLSKKLYLCRSRLVEKVEIEFVWI